VSAPHTQHQGGGGLEDVRALLLEPERARLEALETLLVGKPERASAMAEVLVEALVERSKRGEPELARALRPLVEEALRLSVRRTPATLAETLFPVFGPAIRRTIAQTLSAVTEALSRTLDQTLTPRAWGWRLEAWRTGRSFGEIVLLRTLEYRVEQVFWIHRDTGLVLVHEHLAHSAGADAALVSAMLTAIRDFARDSFDAQGDLDRFQLGELEVRVASSPQAVLAVVVRGAPPADLGTTLEETLEGLHLRFEELLLSFQGDTGAFDAAREDLRALLVASYRGADRRAKTGADARRVWLVLGAALALVLGLIGWNAWRGDAERMRWEAFLTAVRGEPGIVVTGVSSAPDGSRLIEGLRDPLASSVEDLGKLAPAGVRVAWRLGAFQSLEPVFVLLRSRTLLRPPASVRLALEDGVLYASGSASRAWLEVARVRSAGLVGVSRFMLRGLAVVGEGSP
jgi:OOP family OmpA-OmpF porin